MVLLFIFLFYLSKYKQYFYIYMHCCISYLMYIRYVSQFLSTISYANCQWWSSVILWSSLFGLSIQQFGTLPNHRTFAVIFRYDWTQWTVKHIFGPVANKQLVALPCHKNFNCKSGSWLENDAILQQKSTKIILIHINNITLDILLPNTMFYVTQSPIKVPNALEINIWKLTTYPRHLNWYLLMDIITYQDYCFNGFINESSNTFN